MTRSSVKVSDELCMVSVLYHSGRNLAKVQLIDSQQRSHSLNIDSESLTCSVGDKIAAIQNNLEFRAYRAQKRLVLCESIFFHHFGLRQRFLESEPEPEDEEPETESPERIAPPVISEEIQIL